MSTVRLARAFVALGFLVGLAGGVRPALAQEEAAGEEDDPATRLERLIETDRNSFTFTPLTTDPGRLIAEVSYTYFDAAMAEPKHSFPEFLVRYGLTRHIELRFGWNYETGGSEDPGVADIANFFGADMQQQALYGAKLSLTAQRGLRPASAVFAQAHSPTGGPQVATQLRAGYSLGWELPNDWIFDAAFEFGTDTIEGDDYTLWAPSAVLKIPFGPDKRWFTHVEYFSVVSDGKQEPFSNHFIDTGLHRLITDNVEFGGILGFGLNPEAPPVIVSIGLGVRF